MPLAAVTGLAAEARIARARGVLAVATGGVAARTAAAAERLLESGTMSLVSFGIAGGLAPSLASGALLLPRAVRDEAGTIFPVDAAWRERVRDALLALGLAPDEGEILGAARIVALPEEKAMLHRSSGAVAVDLESHIVALAARRSGRPFLALRAVADPASFALPAAAAVGLDAEGRPALMPVLLSVLREPDKILALLRLARHTRRALRALERAAQALA